MDLVLPQLTHFNSNEHADGFTISYSYGSPYVEEKTDKMITCGRIPICTIQTNQQNGSVSRCNFILIKIKDELIILSGGHVQELNVFQENMKKQKNILVINV